MRHSVKTKTLDRFSSYRLATIKSIVRAILKYQRIKTTRPKAKLAQQQLERLISLAKEGSLFSKRRAYSFLGDHDLVKYLFEKIGPLFKNRNSGFSRIIYFHQRRGDNAQMVLLELTEREEKKKAKEKIAKEQPKPEITEKPQAAEKPTIKEKLLKEKPLKEKKPKKKFLGGLRTFFKKERDSL